MRDDQRAYLEELLAGIGPIRIARMFGGHGIYRDGLFFAIVIDGRIYLKTDSATEPAFAQTGSTPFAFERGAKTMVTSYWSAPDEAMDSSEAMLPWARLALEAAARKPPPKTRKKTR